MLAESFPQTLQYIWMAKLNKKWFLTFYAQFKVLTLFASPGVLWPPSHLGGLKSPLGGLIRGPYLHPMTTGATRVIIDQRMAPKTKIPPNVSKLWGYTKWTWDIANMKVFSASGITTGQGVKGHNRPWNGSKIEKLLRIGGNQPHIVNNWRQNRIRGQMKRSRRKVSSSCVSRRTIAWSTTSNSSGPSSRIA